jgi:4a-hydroxytetrahydrobiopterin dehydratase
MTRPTKLPDSEIQAWLDKHPGWERVGDAISKTFKKKDFAGAMAVAVKVGMAAEEKNHHPDIEIGWGRARVTWSTHDAGGITSLDLEMAEATDAAA